jgi:3'(2'), 5'-bisphosphate nucleotidase
VAMINSNQLENLKKLVIELGEEVELIKKRQFNYDLKKDGSPISEADQLVNVELNKFILKTDFKNVISEENKQISYSKRKEWDYYWVIDPIDGTKEFINKLDQYTINIALCFKDRPIFGLVSCPAFSDIYIAQKGKGAKKNDEMIRVSNLKKSINVVASKSHLSVETTKFIEGLKKKYRVNLKNYGSSLKICKIAEGEAHIYPRLNPTMEWDTCAADIILSESGGVIVDLSNNRLSYNKPCLNNPHFIAKVN